jgi:hypothetical protein
MRKQAFTSTPTGSLVSGGETMDEISFVFAKANE